MGEVTNLASGGGGWFAEQLSTYFRALLYSKARKYANTGIWGPPSPLARFPNLANYNLYR